MKHCILVLITLLFSQFLLAGYTVPQQRAQNLAKGVNLMDWFFHNPAYDLPEQNNYITGEDLQRIKDAGFTHVRLPIDPRQLIVEVNPSELNPRRLPVLDSAILKILEHDLAVVIDIHHSGRVSFRHMLSNEFFQDRFITFWQALAKHYQALNPDRVFFELFNQPYVEDDQVWIQLQERLVHAIREVAPEHTIIVTANRLPWIDNMTRLPLIDDTNLIYTFHYYRPRPFNRQYISWDKNVGPAYIPYPSSPEILKSLSGGELHPEVADALGDFANRNWNLETHLEEIGKAKEWADSNNLALYCGELGISDKVHRGDRERWFQDTRTALEQHGIGWCIWAYTDQGGFGLVPGDPSQRAFHPGDLKALGLSKAGELPGETLLPSDTAAGAPPAM